MIDEKLGIMQQLREWWESFKLQSEENNLVYQSMKDKIVNDLIEKKRLKAQQKKDKKLV